LRSRACDTIFCKRLSNARRKGSRKGSVRRKAHPTAPPLLTGHATGGQVLARQRPWEEASDGLGGEEFDGGYTDEFPEDQDDDDQYVEDEPLGDDEAAFADDQEEPVRMGGARRYARPRDNRDDDPCWADDCDPQYAAAARGRPAYRPKLLSNLSRFPKRGRVPDATWSDERDSPSTPVKTIEMPPWTRSSASPFVERREDGSFSMSEAIRHATADPAQTAAVAKAAENQFRRWQARRLEGIA
jgi:hypothetical protein